MLSIADINILKPFDFIWFYFFLKCRNRWIFHLGASCNLPLHYSTVKSPEDKHPGSLRTTTTTTTTLFFPCQVNIISTWHSFTNDVKYKWSINSTKSNTTRILCYFFIHTSNLYFTWTRKPLSSSVSMRQSHRRVNTYAQRRLDSFVSVCVCAHCRYTQHILTVYLSHV